MLSDEQKYEILKAGFYRYTDCLGKRYWNPDWGPRPPEDIIAHDPRPVPPPRQYADR